MTEKTSEQVYLGLVIAIPIFFCLNAVLAYIGGRWQKKLAHKTSEDVLTAHYLGGQVDVALARGFHSVHL